MESDVCSSSVDFVKCSNCGFTFSLAARSSGSLIQTIKQREVEFVDNDGLNVPVSSIRSNARTLVETEHLALREAFSNQQQTIQRLYGELEKERHASSSAANEAMSMMLRLQSEKSEIQMESRQFKIFAEEKMAHDEEELMVLENLLSKREQMIRVLACEVHAFKHRLMSHRITEEGEEGENIDFDRKPILVDADAQFDLSFLGYPPLKCNIYKNQDHLEGDDSVNDTGRLSWLSSPCEREDLKTMEWRTNQLESPVYKQMIGEFSEESNVSERVIVGQSPKQSSLYRKLPFSGSSGPRSPLGFVREAKMDSLMDSPQSTCSFKMIDCEDKDNASDIRDDMSDRIYTIDCIQEGVQHNGFDTAKKAAGEFGDGFPNSPGYQDALFGLPEVHDVDIKKLYRRLQELEADRESMRQTILSMKTNNAQLVLLKEIAQNFSKEMSPANQSTVRKGSFLGGFSFISVCKLIVSLVFWKKKAHKTRFTYQLPANNMSLLMLSDESPRTRDWRCLTSSRV